MAAEALHDSCSVVERKTLCLLVELVDLVALILADLLDLLESVEQPEWVGSEVALAPRCCSSG